MLIEVFVVYLVMPFSGYFKIQDAAQIIWNPLVGSSTRGGCTGIYS